MTKSVQAINRKNPRTSKEILFDLFQQYDNQREEPVDDISEVGPTSDGTENTIKTADKFLVVLYALT